MPLPLSILFQPLWGMCLVRSAFVSSLCLGLAAPLGVAAIHYARPPCGPDEVQAEVLDGVSGYLCTPRCAENTYDCPSDVPDFAAAQAQCMLKDVDGGAFCALLCSVDTQCPNGARCQRLQQAGVGVCMYPLGFTDWVHQGSSRKLSYGLPQRKDSAIPPGMVSKAVAAMQNLKFKYGIQDGDADVVIVKEFLSRLPGSSGFPGATPGVGTGIYSASTIASPSGGSGGSGNTPAPAVVAASQVAASPQRSELSKVESAYAHDWSYAKDRLGEGLPGIEKAVGDAVWEAENLGVKNNASTLLRHLLELALIYLALGAAYKYQALGARGIDMVPHIGFWMDYPQLVNDGVAYAKQLALGEGGMQSGGSFGGGFGGGGGGFEPVGRAERDTFAQFEPSK